MREHLVDYVAICYMVGGLLLLFAAEMVEGIWSFLDNRSEEGKIVFWAFVWGLSPIVVPLTLAMCLLWFLAAISITFIKGIGDWVMGPIR